MNKYTKGNWKFDGEDIIGDRYVCRLTDWHITSAGTQYDAINQKLSEEREANAALIASAPELLGALKDALIVFDSLCKNGQGICPNNATHLKIKQAIRKAENK